MGFNLVSEAINDGRASSYASDCNIGNSSILQRFDCMRWFRFERN